MQSRVVLLIIGIGRPWAQNSPPRLTSPGFSILLQKNLSQDHSKVFHAFIFGCLDFIIPLIVGSAGGVGSLGLDLAVVAGEDLHWWDGWMERQSRSSQIRFILINVKI